MTSCSPLTSCSARCRRLQSAIQLHACAILCLTLLLRPIMLRALALSIVAPCRRMVQVHVCTSDVHARLSQFAKRELHSLANYLLTSFSDQDVSLFTRHFVKVGPQHSVKV